MQSKGGAPEDWSLVSSDSPLVGKEEAAPNKEVAPSVPTVCSDGILVETEMLITSMSSMELRKPVEAMEVVSLEQLSKPAIPTLVSNQPIEMSGIPGLDVVVYEHVPVPREWGETPALSLGSPPQLGSQLPPFPQ